jgi:dihydropteroate synthase
MAPRPPVLPLGLNDAADAPADWPRLAGGWRACSAVRIPEGMVAEAAQALPRIFSRARPSFAGLAMDRPHIMGILNVTPDSFSGGGTQIDTDALIEQGRRMAEAGASIIDVGGESTRPGAPDVDPAVEAARIEPLVRALAQSGLLVSIDTRRASVMAIALEAGARIVNDVSALADPAALPLVAQRRVPTILMHMRGTPATMQRLTDYEDVVAEVYASLAERVGACLAAGMSSDLLCVDPGIGFAKTADQNVALLSHLAAFHGVGLPILVGASRKRLVADLSKGEGAAHRLPGSLAIAQSAWAAGAQIVRVHDVAETAQALAVWGAVSRVSTPMLEEEGSER